LTGKRSSPDAAETDSIPSRGERRLHRRIAREDRHASYLVVVFGRARRYCTASGYREKVGDAHTSLFNPASGVFIATG
jgi:hypothetical protein